MTVATGGPVERRPARLIHLMYNQEGVRVDGDPTPCRLNITNDNATKQGQACATYLRQMTAALRRPTAGGDGSTARLLHFAAADAAQNARISVLRELGQGLWDQLGDEFRDALHSAFAGKSGPDRLPPQFIARHLRALAPFPWELLYEPAADDPDGPTDWRRFWGFRHPLSRWPDRNRYGRIRLDRASLSVACESLTYSHREVSRVWETLSHLAPALRHDYLPAMLARELQSPAAPPTELCAVHDRLRQVVLSPDEPQGKANAFTQKVNAIFESHVWNVYHFACHAEANPLSQTLSALQFQLGGCQLSFSVRYLKSRKAESNALVFLNACSTAEVTDTVEPAGLPLACIEGLGALAVVATVCPVPDAFAHHFALAFYGYLVGRDPDGTPTPPLGLASAMVAARCHFMEKYNNPLGLAYTLYASEETDLEFGRGDRS